MLRKIFFWPSQNVALVVPVTLAAGLTVGLLVNTGVLRNYILLVTVLMIYPVMIGFKLRELVNLSHGRLLLVSLLINFAVNPLLAYAFGTAFLLRDPQLFAGLAIVSLFPTSNMTIAFTMLAKGNVPAAVKLTTTGLILGSLLAPWYLLLMVGKYVPVDVWLTLKTVTTVVALPLVLGLITYSLLLRKYTEDEFKQRIKPYLPAASSWGMIFLIFTSVSTNAPRIAAHLDLVAVAFLVVLVFYAVNYFIGILTGRTFFPPGEAVALVFSTALRNLSISLGLAATAFGPNAALMVALGFLIQQQAAAWFIRFNEKYGLVSRKKEALST